MSIDNKIIDQASSSQELERTSEEETLIMRIAVFTKMRWFSILGVVVITMVAQFVFKVSFPVIPVFTVCGFIALYNLILIKQVRGLKKMAEKDVMPRVRRYIYYHILLDMFALTVLLHFTGGIENPFIFFFVYHIVLASIGLNYRVVYLLSTIAMFMVSLMVGLECAGILPHVDLQNFISPTRYQETTNVVAELTALALLLYGITYVTTAITGELRKRQRQVDILRERLLEEKNCELINASAEIKKLEQEKNRFLRFIGIAAHDLKAPLTAIQGFLWVMLGGYAGDISQKQKNMLERSTQRITELLTLISDLLDIPRIETGQIVPEMALISFNQIIKDAVENQSNLAKDKGLNITVDIPSDLPEIKGSASRLQQVITNLINNAITYTDEGSIAVRVIEQEHNLLVEVQDTGIGVPEAEIPKLFEDFFRASNVGKKGTGLGLSISRRIIEIHGGRIWAESPPAGTKKGSKFSFTLPKLKTSNGD